MNIQRLFLFTACLAMTVSAAPPELARTMIFTMQEMTDSDHGLELGRQAGSEFFIRGWFKWGQAPDFARLRGIADQAHAMNARFGGGITCSALYDRENGITREQLLDMATRGPDGQLVEAWGQPGIRHGSLSSPAYLDYLFRWCREQINAVADYLFMDEHTAVLAEHEGFDDHSLADFGRYLLEVSPTTAGWKPDDARWSSEYLVSLTNCADGTMRTFDFRTYLQQHGLTAKPLAPENKLAPLWRDFRAWRDDRAWKGLTDRIRAYAKERGRTVLISANGLAKYVDIQVLGVWDHWAAENGHIDLRENQLAAWRSQVERGQLLASKPVPTVFFHDWGFGNPPFPFQAVPPAERILWMRTRGPEIFAAGARFAYPVLGPFGCDAKRDGTLDAIAHQAAFFRLHRDLFVDASFLGCTTPTSTTPYVSLSISSLHNGKDLVLHVINRNVTSSTLQAQTGVVIQLPLSVVPARATVLSPDFEGETPLNVRRDGNELAVTIERLDAYCAAVLHFDAPVDVAPLRDPVRTATAHRWERPARSNFVVRADGLIEDADDLQSFLQGQFHAELRNPPTFLVNAVSDGRLLVHVRAVATAGAKIEYRIDGVTKQTLDLPDLDGKNEDGRAEYDRTFALPIPAGTHRLTLDNVGGDWAVVPWIAFDGRFRDASR